jgi:hypothetical protein
LTFVMYANYAFGFFAGVHFIHNSVFNSSSGSDYIVGDVITVFLSVVNSSYLLGSVGSQVS